MEAIIPPWLTFGFVEKKMMLQHTSINFNVIYDFEKMKINVVSIIIKKNYPRLVTSSTKLGMAKR